MKENFISCVLWVPKGVSKPTPDEVKLSPEELKELIQETRSDIKDIEPDFEDEEDLNGENEDETEDKEEGDEPEEDGGEEDFEIDEESTGDKESEENDEDDAEEKCQETKDKADDSDEDIISKYDMDNYDDDDDGRPCMRINDVTMFVDNRDDQYMEESNSEDEDKIEEKVNMQIQENDNLLVVGHIEGDRCTVVVHVYNKEEDDFYVHHEIDMAAFPVALEWMDFHPSEEERGSYVVIGDMTPVISVWDLDVIGASVPDYCLGKKKKQKKTNLKGHTESVVSLSWNKKLRNILASGSADETIILWDLLNCKGEKLLKYHKGQVQALEWDPSEYNYLLSGCTGGLIGIYDYRTDSNKAAHMWKVEGEVERVCWNKSQSSKFLCSTDQGFVYSFDMNVSTYQHRIEAHKENVTVLDISPDYPNLLMTGGYDQFIKVWDLDMISSQSDKALKSVYAKKTVVGKIFAAKFAPDSELIAAVGGHCPSNNLKILDLGELKPGMNSVDNAIPENDMDEELTSPKKKKKKKLQKFHLKGEQQSTENDVYAAGSSSTENMTENVDESAPHLPSFQLKKKKKNKLNRVHHHYEQQQNGYSAGPSSCTNDNHNFVPKKKKRKHSQIN